MNIAIAQSGGPTCVINTSLLGVYKQALKEDKIDLVYGSLNGIEGVINDNLVVLNDQIKTQEDMELIRQTPATMLGSCRFKMPEVEADSPVYKSILKTFQKRGIEAFFYIGGNDSMDTVNKLSKYFKMVGSDIKVMGVPKTIDNDLCETDHTPGFGSAAKYIATTLKEIVRDACVYDLDSAIIVEIMGRDTGWLTASSAVLRATGEQAPHLIYLPEVDFSIEKFIADIKESFKKTRSVVIAISEGVTPDVEGGDSAYMSGQTDAFGHKYLSGIGKLLENIVREKVGCKVRSVELNVMQRCSSHLGSLTDIEEAEKIGAIAVQKAMEGKTGEIAVFLRSSNAPYNIAYDSVPAERIANKVKYFPKEWVNEAGNNVTDDAINYVLPLIQGEINTVTENGLPKHFIIKK